jgi:hypothetical protein
MSARRWFHRLLLLLFSPAAAGADDDASIGTTGTNWNVSKGTNWD